MGQRKKIDVFNDDLDSEDGPSREDEDAASRARIAQYEKIENKQLRSDAIEAENLWRESIDLEPI